MSKIKTRKYGKISNIAICDCGWTDADVYRPDLIKKVKAHIRKNKKCTVNVESGDSTDYYLTK